MRGIVWGLYGLGVLGAVSVLVDGSLGVVPKTLIAILVVFAGALLAAILNLADAVRSTKGALHISTAHPREPAPEQ
jgi:hypothetical protein